MKILVIGNGGREHAIAWKLASEDRVSKVYVAPGNGGTHIEDKCENVNIKMDDIDSLIKFSKENAIDFTVVGPEKPLTDGIVDKFKENGLKIFGPSKDAALLEGSKSFAKEFMKKYGVKTAAYEKFTDKEEAIEYLNGAKYPLVIKADGLAAGKGVIICEDKEIAFVAVHDLMENDVFDGAGLSIVVEEFLEGVEASILSVTDGETIVPFISAKDHKKIGDLETGLNTGGMGVICPNPYVNEKVLEEFNENILKNTLKGIKEEKFDFVGVIFFGLMINKNGVYLLEYNVRMGDPETQAVLPLMENAFSEVIESAIDKKLCDVKMQWKDKSCVNVVLASGGYPKEFKKGLEISINDINEGKVFIAGGEFKDDKLVTSGGRVLSLTAFGNDMNEARELCYNEIKNISFEGAYHRNDIGKVF